MMRQKNAVWTAGEADEELSGDEEDAGQPDEEDETSGTGTDTSGAEAAVTEKGASDVKKANDFTNQMDILQGQLEGMYADGGTNTNAALNVAPSNVIHGIRTRTWKIP